MVEVPWGPVPYVKIVYDRNCLGHLQWRWAWVGVPGFAQEAADQGPGTED